jgi:SNF2 family DNA or RNA helicase
MLAELEGDEIWVGSNYAERNLVKQLPGVSYSHAKEQWHLKASWTACLSMRALFGSSLTLGPNLAAYGAEQALAEQELHRLSKTMVYDGDTEYDPRMFKYQKAGAEFLRTGAHVILGDDPGLGKTLQAISALQEFPALVICPNSVKRTWANEFAKWKPDVKVQVINGSATQRRKQLEGEYDVAVINWEAVRLHSKLSGYGSIRLQVCRSCGGIAEPRPGEEYKGAVTEAKCEKHQRELNTAGFKTVIVDEAHRMKDPNAKQTRAVWSVLHGARYRYALTGTPVGDNVGDLWSLLHGVDPVAFPVKSKFLDLYADTRLNFFGGFEVLGLNPERRDVFHRVLSSYMRRTPKKLALPELPPKMPETYRYVKMRPAQAKQYKQMRDGYLTLLDDGTPMVAATTLSQLTRLRQYACATGSTDGALAEPSCKVDDLVDFISDNGGKPLVVAAVSKQLINLAAARLGKEGCKIGLITGDQTLDERAAAERRFQSGELDVILLTQAAGGTGITLTAADTIYFMERSYSVTENTQTEDRVYRIGSEIHSSINVVVSISEGTVEDDRELRLAVKEGRIEEIVQDRERLRRVLCS